MKIIINNESGFPNAVQILDEEGNNLLEKIPISKIEIIATQKKNMALLYVEYPKLQVRTEATYEYI